MGLTGVFKAVVTFLFFIFNFVIFLGAVLFIIVVIRLQSLTETKQDSSHFLAVNALIIIGAFVAVIACLGCYGVATNNRVYLLLNITLMIVLIMLQFGFGTYFLERSTELKYAVFDNFKNLKLQVPLNHLMHAIQRQLNCCGVDGYKEWIEKIQSIPGSCCNKPANNDTCLESEIKLKKIPPCRGIIDREFDKIMTFLYSTVIIYILEVIVIICAIYILLSIGRSDSSRYIVNVGPSMKKELFDEGEFSELGHNQGVLESDINKVAGNVDTHNIATDSCTTDLVKNS